MLNDAQNLELSSRGASGAQVATASWNLVDDPTQIAGDRLIHPYLRLYILARPQGRSSESPCHLPGLRTPPGASGRSESLRSPLFRRVLGKALLDLFCPHGEPRCQPDGASSKADPRDRCALATSCPYGMLFAASSLRRPPFALYVLPHKGSDLRLELTLYGEAWRLHPWALAALQRAFRVGLGKARQRWALHSVSRVEPGRRRLYLCGSDLRRLPAIMEPDDLGLRTDPRLTPRPIEVRFLSPTRLIRDGRLLRRQAPVPFEVLVGRALDRFSGLYGEGVGSCLSRPMRKAIEADAARVQLLSDKTRWVRGKDYSSRSGKEFELGGRVGRLVYSDGAARFFPILRAAEVLHLGKNVTAGCGRIRVDLAPVMPG